MNFESCNYFFEPGFNVVATGISFKMHQTHSHLESTPFLVGIFMLKIMFRLRLLKNFFFSTFQDCNICLVHIIPGLLRDGIVEVQMGIYRC